jgi:hypothetical protein
MSTDAKPTVSYEFRRARAKRSSAIVIEAGAAGDRPGGDPEAARRAPGRLPRVTRLLALAYRFDDLLAKGEVPSMAELARLGGVTRARVSQITDLTLLAPDIQEEILEFCPVERGRDPVTMRDVHRVLGALHWPDQRRRWQAAKDGRRRTRSG